MTQDEQQSKIHQLYYKVADLFKELQTLSDSLIDAENREKTLTTVHKIKDATEQVNRLYTEIDFLLSEPIWEGGSTDDNRDACGLLCEE